ncbi:hypothetical protein ANCDUO_03067 [Ancylostoma duodenale]|uniref:Uncharacterized protein n=1 Tax=Ancylostoma duodenale TaxID=51022 RepID=A0A0C2DUT6_9BILA|nr:hypothetical protein ANCDUO_03067 [Ancylostoma duodenale]
MFSIGSITAETLCFLFSFLACFLITTFASLSPSIAYVSGNHWGKRFRCGTEAVDRHAGDSKEVSGAMAHTDAVQRRLKPTEVGRRSASAPCQATSSSATFTLLSLPTLHSLCQACVYFITSTISHDELYP